MENPKLFQPMFRKRGLLKKSDSWATWKIFLAGLFALPMTEQQREVWRKYTGREVSAEAFQEAYAICGRRSGKSKVASLIATYLAAFKDYSNVLSAGEVGTLMVVASDRRQSATIFGYIRAFFQTPMLKPLILSELKESITLTNHIRIEIHTSSYKAVRGYSLVGCIADEAAFWESESSANPAGEVLNAIRPGLATTGGLLLVISSPYSKSGVLYENYRQHYGKSDSPILVWKAASREMNETLPVQVVERALARDRAAAAAEYLAEFRDDIGGFLSVEEIERVIVPGRTMLPFIGGMQYRAFCDPSGGRSDSMTLGIAHGEGERAILDLLREIHAPFSPAEAVREFCQLMKGYRVSEVTGDRYSAEWVKEAFERQGIRYLTSEKNRSEIYLEFLPALTSGQIELLESERLKQQFASLQRRTSGAGRDNVDHGVGAHDDLCNAASGALCRVLEESSKGILGMSLLFEKYTREISQGIRNSWGELINKPKPIVVRGDPVEDAKAKSFQTWQGRTRNQEGPPCLNCGKTCTTFLGGPPRLHCNYCGADDGIKPLPTIVDGKCPKCGLKLNWSGGVQICQNDGQVQTTESVPRGATFRDLKRSRCG